MNDGHEQPAGMDNKCEVREVITIYFCHYLRESGKGAHTLVCVSYTCSTGSASGAARAEGRVPWYREVTRQVSR